MKRIDTSTKSVDLFGAGKHGFKDGDKVHAVAPTQFNASWANSVQEELASTVEGFGIIIDPGDNQQLFKAINKGIGGVLNKSVAGSADITLTEAESANGILKFTGALAADINIVVSAVIGRKWTVQNATTGDFLITIKTAAGAGKKVTQSVATSIYTDGIDVLYAGSASAVEGIKGRSYNYLGATIRSIGGVFSFIDDANHRPTGFASISQPDAYTIRMTYNVAAKRITNFNVNADDALAPYGVVAGGDVGMSYANIVSFAPFTCTIDSSSTLGTTTLWAGAISAAASGASIVITHPPASSASDNATISAHEANGETFDFMVAQTANTVTITPVDLLNGFVSYGGAAFTQALSSNYGTPVSLSWTASNTLRITHVDGGAYRNGIKLTGHGGVYIPQIVDIQATYFEVAFFDYAGVKITTPNANMQFWYERNIRVISVWPIGITVKIMRGLCAIPVANFSNVAGNNLWVTGVMEG